MEIPTNQLQPEKLGKYGQKLENAKKQH